MHDVIESLPLPEAGWTRLHAWRPWNTARPIYLVLYSFAFLLHLNLHILFLFAGATASHILSFVVLLLCTNEAGLEIIIGRNLIY
ncbi:hypothetical protein K431DRAFT_95902 [Polychaeton citri CBS 116435]|uniref:Uncharacterized protein n=1 Tax=Polychaeton citri CBS 116435 TaxID=1314669 RepID=A0A9P4Q882_9PEZI|nr:hypothetical protein K431DRAFT_95902 [Polychaeton citri CBS 116435]